jgi:CubicO group peptidase (beta-lactamase class C family)
VKTFLSVIMAAVLAAGCNSISQPKPVVKDSVRHDLPVSGQLSAKEYTYYHQLVSHYFDSALLTRNFNGTVLVAKNGVIVFEAYHGLRDLRQKDDSLTADTPMHIASASKTFTGMAVLQLIEEGKLNLDDTLSKFFPGFPYPGVTVKTLLNHRSGLPNYVHYLESLGWDKSKPVTNEEVLQSLFTLKPGKEAEPDRRFSYSNTNYLLLAMIIEKITGTPYPVYMKEQFFTPLHMDHTFVATDADSARLTPSFNGWGRYWQPDFLDKTYGDKNIYTTARDLLKWDVAVSNGQIIGQALLDSAYTPYSNERPSIHNYGLAWRLLTLPNGKKVIYHNGRWHGTNSAFARLLDEKATIIVIGNRYNNNIYRSARGAYDLFGDYLQQSNNEEDDENVAQKKAVHSSSHHATALRKSSARPRKAKK